MTLLINSNTFRSDNMKYYNTLIYYCANISSILLLCYTTMLKSQVGYLHNNFTAFLAMRVCSSGDRPRNCGGRRFKGPVPSHSLKGTDISKLSGQNRQTTPILAHFCQKLTKRQTKFFKFCENRVKIDSF